MDPSKADSQAQTSTSAQQPQQPQLPLHPKLRDSCTGCAKSKVKCGREKPCCRRCARRGTPCVYPQSKRTGKPRPIPANGCDDTTTDARESQETSSSPLTTGLITPWDMDIPEGFFDMDDWLPLWADLPQSTSSNGVVGVGEGDYMTRLSPNKVPLSNDVPVSEDRPQMPSPSATPPHERPQSPSCNPTNFSEDWASFSTTLEIDSGISVVVKKDHVDENVDDTFAAVFRVFATLFADMEGIRSSNNMSGLRKWKPTLASNRDVIKSLASILDESTSPNEHLLHLLIGGAFKIISTYRLVVDAVSKEEPVASRVLLDTKRPHHTDVFSELASSLASPLSSAVSYPGQGHSDSRKDFIVLLKELHHIQNLINNIAHCVTANHRRLHNNKRPISKRDSVFSAFSAGNSRTALPEASLRLTDTLYCRLVPDLKNELSSLSGQILTLIRIMSP